MSKQIKQLIHVLWAIEKDLHVIASNKEVKNDNVRKTNEQIGEKVSNPY